MVPDGNNLLGTGAWISVWLLLISVPIEASIFDFPESCPDGTVVCLMTGKCVTPDGKCPKRPTCEADEKLQWNKFGYYECIPMVFGDFSCGKDMYFCMETGHCMYKDRNTGTDRSDRTNGMDETDRMDENDGMDENNEADGIHKTDGTDGICSANVCAKFNQVECVTESGRHYCAPSDQCKIPDPCREDYQSCDMNEETVCVPRGQCHPGLGSFPCGDDMDFCLEAGHCVKRDGSCPANVCEKYGQVECKREDGLSYCHLDKCPWDHALYGVHLTVDRFQFFGRSGKRETSYENRVRAVIKTKLVNTGLRLVDLRAFPQSDKKITILAKLESEAQDGATESPNKAKVAELMQSTRLTKTRDDISVHSVSEDAQTLVFLITEPVIRGEERTFTLAAVLPQEVRRKDGMRLSMKNSPITLKLLKTGAKLDDSTAVSLDDEIVVTHRYETATLMKVCIEPGDREDRKVCVGFIAIPGPLAKDSSDIILQEDAGCVPFFSALKLKNKDNGIFQVFSGMYKAMESEKEYWAGDFMDDVQVLLFNEDREQRDAAKVAELKQKKRGFLLVSLDQETAYSKKKYVAHFEEKTKRNPKIVNLWNSGFLKLCPTKNYHGEFFINLKLLSAFGHPLELQVKVQIYPVNDAPVLIRDASRWNPKDQLPFVFPKVPDSGTGKDEETFSVKPIVDYLCSDETDGHLVTGLAIEKVMPGIVTSGTWSVKTIKSSDWLPIDRAIADHSTFVALDRESFIRFQLGERYKGITWISHHNPKLTVRCFDGKTTGIIKCSTESEKLCQVGGTGHLSKDSFSLSLSRYGCDDVAGSGKVVDEICGCGITKCDDCHGTKGGSAKIDICGACAGGDTGIPFKKVVDCSNAACAKKFPGYCKSMNLDCEKGKKFTECKACIAETETVSQNYVKDKCRVCGGDNSSCTDCEGRVGGGKKKDICGFCLDPNSTKFNQGCKKLGKIHPEKVCRSSMISLRVGASLPLVSSEQISCALVPNGSPVNKAIPYTVSADNIEKSGHILISLKKVGDLTDFKSESFKLKCVFSGTYTVVTTGSVLISRTPQPAVTKVNPPVLTINADQEVTVIGNGFKKSMTIICYYECDDNDWLCRTKDRFGLSRLQSYGRVISDTEVKCDVKKILQIRKSREYKLYLIQRGCQTEETPKPSSSLKLTVTLTAQAPVLQSITKSRDSCSILFIRFNTYIKVWSGPFRSLIPGTKFDCSKVIIGLTQGASCLIYKNVIKVALKRDVQEGRVLRIRDKSIVNVNAGRNPQYASGSKPIELPQNNAKLKVRIDGPDSVGDTPIRLRAVLGRWGSGCVDMSWSVTVSAKDAADSKVKGKLAKLNQKLKKLKRMISISRDELVTGVAFKFFVTATYKINSETVTREHTVNRDDTKKVNLRIRMRKIVDASKKTTAYCNMEKSSAFAKTKNGDMVSEGIHVIRPRWAILPEIGINLNDGVKVKIPAKALEDGKKYTLQCYVKVNGKDVKTEAVFITKHYPLHTNFKINGKDKDIVKVPHDADVLLVTDSSFQHSNFLWQCQDNRNGENFVPSVIFGEDKKPKSISKSGVGLREFKIPTEVRYHLREGNFRMKCTLTEERGSQTKKRSKLIEFISDQSESTETDDRSESPETSDTSEHPEIMLPKGPIKITRDWTNFKLKAWCKNSNQYSWISETGKGYSPLDFGMDKISVNLKKSARLQPCGTEINVTVGDLTQGLKYKLTITAVNDENEHSESIVLMTKAQPECVDIEVSRENLPLTTQPVFSVNAECHVEDSNAEDDEDEDDINEDDEDDTEEDEDLCYKVHLTEASGKENRETTVNSYCAKLPLKFTSEPGNFNVTVEVCRSDGPCKRFHANALEVLEENVTPEIASEMKKHATEAIETVSPTGIQDLLNIGKILKKIPSDEKSVQDLKAFIDNGINMLLKEQLEVFDDFKSDKVDLQHVFRKSAQVLSEKVNLDPATVKTILKMVQGFAESLTGGKSLSTRRKRAVESELTESAEPSGIDPSQAKILLDTFTNCDIESKGEDAGRFLATLDAVMKGLCQASISSEPFAVDTNLVAVRTKLTNLAGNANTPLPVGCSSCSSFTSYPSVWNPGKHLEEMYGQQDWVCNENGIMCTDTCLASAQISKDVVTVTAEMEIDAPERRSDLIITKIFNPETDEEVDHTELHSPAMFSLPVIGSLDESSQPLKCLMWISDTWNDSVCTTGIPVVEPSSSMPVITCSCFRLGILGVFEEALSEQEIISQLMMNSPVNKSINEKAADKVMIVPDTQSNHIDAEATYLDGRVTSHSDYNTYIESTEAKEGTENRIHGDLVDQLHVSSRSVSGVRVMPGSIIISFNLYSDPAGQTLGQIAYKLEDLVKTGNLLLHNANGVVIPLDPNSLTLQNGYASTTSDDSVVGDVLHYIISGVVGGLVLLTLVLIVVITVKKKKSKINKTCPSPMGSQVEVLSCSKATPPPSYEESAVTHSKIWSVEDLVMMDRKQKLCSPMGSSISMDRRLYSKPEDGPTPVG